MKYFAALLLLLTTLAAPAAAQDGERSDGIAGRWEACFQVDSVDAGGIVETCGVLTFTADSACGVAILEYTVPFDSLFAGVSTARRTVGYRTVGDTVHFGGGITKGAQPGSCRIWTDDASLNGSVILQGGELVGEWGMSSYFDDRPIGTVVMKRRWTQ